MTIDTPNVDWFALSPVVAMTAAAGALLLVAVFVPKRHPRSSSRRAVCGAGFVAAFVLAILVADQSPDGGDGRRRLDLPRPLGRRRADPDRGAAACSRC